jgi:hypothetical protein
MTGMKINIKKRNGMMSNIANTAVLKRREGAGDEDSIAGTKTGVEVKVIYCKYSETTPFHGTTSFHGTESCHESIHRKYSDTQEINNNNNNNNDISGNDNISGDSIAGTKTGVEVEGIDCKYITCYLKAAALLLFVLERPKSQQSTSLLFYVNLMFMQVRCQICLQ